MVSLLFKFFIIHGGQSIITITDRNSIGGSQTVVLLDSEQNSFMTKFAIEVNDVGIEQTEPSVASFYILFEGESRDN